MPRIENTGTNVAEYCEESGEGSSTFDICNGCCTQLEYDPHVFDCILSPYNGDPQGIDGYEVGGVHPDYEGERYTCETCFKPLTARDN